MRLGPADGSAMAAAAAQINAASKPIVLLGLQTSQAELASGLQAFLQQSSIPYGATLQGSGRWVAPEHFVGRVGLFRNQPADRLLDAADCVITVGFDAIEYDPSLWNSGNQRPLVAIDVEPVAQDQAFLPTA